jgi:hypothetical protein
MVSTSNLTGRDPAVVIIEDDLARDELTRSAVSWGAIFVGAVAAAAVTLILIVLGTGLGLTMVSPWAGMGASAATIGVSAVIWVVVVQWLSSGVGGFLAGRLRTKLVRLHTHEVFFRDTAHGFAAWSLATVAGAVLFALATAHGVAGTARGAADAAALAAAAAPPAPGSQQDYFVDLLLRTTNPIVEVSKRDTRAETERILERSIQDGKITLAPEDKTYIAQMVAARTGANQVDAETRVDQIVTQLNDAEQKARAAADEARKRTSQVAILTALSMVIGAFIAAAAAALGGRARDDQDSFHRI